VAELVTMITGTRKGIGRHLAQHYLARGHRVVGCSRQPSDLEHANYQHFLADVCDEWAVQEIFAVALLPGSRFPDLINDNAEIVGSSFVLPDAALRDVPAELRSNG